MKIHIHSHPGDSHSIAVTCALQQRSHTVYRDVGLGITEGATFRMGTSPDGWQVVHHDGLEHLPSEFDVVWLRRPVGVTPHAGLHPSDRRFVAGEWVEIAKALRYAAADAFWVNPLQAITRATNKPTQLALASEMGLRIPETVITNDVDALGHFLDAHEQVIFKPLHGALWEVEGKKLGAYTSVITRDHLSPAGKIQACPGIYQARVDKAFEVRAQFFGASCFAVTIDSQALQNANVDWRRERGNPTLSTRPIELPETVYQQCRHLMCELDLVSGAFDFIVTPDGEWVFLEVNEAGQFIFLEMWWKDVPILDAFVQFLESRSPDFVYQPSADRIHLAEVFASPRFQEMIRHDDRVHGQYRHPGVIAEVAKVA